MQIKDLRAKLDEVERRQAREKQAGDHEWQAFQWLFDRVPDGDEEDVSLSVIPFRNLSRSALHLSKAAHRLSWHGPRCGRQDVEGCLQMILGWACFTLLGHQQL